jgi:hypothetical protein
MRDGFSLFGYSRPMRDGYSLFGYSRPMRDGYFLFICSRLMQDGLVAPDLFGIVPVCGVYFCFSCHPHWAGQVWNLSGFHL